MTNVPVDEAAAAAAASGSVYVIGGEHEEAPIAEMRWSASDLDRHPPSPLADGNVISVSDASRATHGPRNPLLWPGDQA